MNYNNVNIYIIISYKTDLNNKFSIFYNYHVDFFTKNICKKHKKIQPQSSDWIFSPSVFHGIIFMHSELIQGPAFGRGL